MIVSLLQGGGYFRFCAFFDMYQLHDIGHSFIPNCLENW